MAKQVNHPLRNDGLLLFIAAGAGILWLLVAADACRASAAEVTVSAAEVTVSAAVFPRVVTPGGSLKATCIVRPASEKKLGKLTIEVPGYTSSAKDIEGEDGRNQYTRELWIHHVPCGSEAVVCRLEREDGTRVSRARFEMPACEPADGVTSPSEFGPAGEP